MCVSRLLWVFVTLTSKMKLHFSGIFFIWFSCMKYSFMYYLIHLIYASLRNYFSVKEPYHIYLSSFITQHLCDLIFSVTRWLFLWLDVFCDSMFSVTRYFLWLDTGRDSIRAMTPYQTWLDTGRDLIPDSMCDSIQLAHQNSLTSTDFISSG